MGKGKRSSRNTKKAVRTPATKFSHLKKRLEKNRTAGALKAKTK